MSIELKSTGTLIDELITTELKMAHFQSQSAVMLALSERHEQLDLAITRRLAKQNQKNKDKFHSLSELVLKLRETNKGCWLAQDTVMSLHIPDIDTEDYSDHDYTAEVHSIAHAAKEAQRLNAQRNLYIREIDRLLGESQYTQLEKSYA